MTKVLYSFGLFILNPFERILLRNGEIVPIEPRAFELLHTLVQGENQWVSREQLIQKVWNDANVIDSNLDVQLVHLRKVLQGDGGNAVKLENLRKRGYRLSLPVKRIMPEPQELTEADRMCLEARYQWHLATAVSVKKAIAWFEKAILLDSNCASAYSGVADSYVLAGTFAHQSLSPKEAMPRAKEAALKALALDETLAEAHAALAAVQALYEWNWAAAKQSFDRALEHSPNPMNRAWLSLCLAGRGEHDQAQYYIEEAIKRNPQLFVLKALRGRVYHLARTYDRAVEECQKAIDMEERFYLPHVFLGHTLHRQGKLLEALRSFTTAAKLGHRHPAILSEIGRTQAELGQKQAAKDILQDLRVQADQQYISPHHFFHVFVGLGEKEQALDYLEKAYQNKEAFMIFLSTDPFYDAVQDDPKFVKLIERVGFAYELRARSWGSTI